MRQIQRQRERVLDRGFDSVRPTKLFLNSLEIDEKWGDANGATEMQMTERATRDLQRANQSRPRATHLRFAGLIPAGLA